MVRFALMTVVMACTLMFGACGSENDTPTVPDIPADAVPDHPTTDHPATKPAEEE